MLSVALSDGSAIACGLPEILRSHHGSAERFSRIVHRGRAVRMQYVFIVGLPRTGTKLVRNVIENADSIRARISPETWFFGDLFRTGFRKKILSFGNLQDDEVVERVVRYMFSGAINRSYWQFMSRSDVRANQARMQMALLNSDRSDKAVYAAILRFYAELDPEWSSADRRVVGDKTPGHLYYVPTILQWFPNAKIIHTFRDPRAIMASELKKIVDNKESAGRFGSIRRGFRAVSVVIYITVTWLAAVRLHRRYSKRFEGNYLLSRYEDLVGQPEDAVTRICQFLEIDSSKGMFDPRHRDSSFGRDEEGRGFDTAGLDRWKDYLRPWIRIWLRLFTGRYWERFGYDRR